MSEGEVFRVSDFGFSAYLLVSGFCLVDVASDDRSSRRKVFLLSGTPASFKEIAERFRVGDALVDARDFLAAQRRLKHVLYGFGT